MPTLEFVHNPITGEKARFVSQHSLFLQELLTQFIVLYPEFTQFITNKESRFVILINGVRLLKLQNIIKLKPSDTITIIPDVEGIESLTAALVASWAAASSAATTMGMSALTASAVSTGVAAGAATATGVGVSMTALSTGAIVGTVAGGMVGLASLAGLVGGVVSLFSSHEPSMGGDSSDGGPGSNSPTYSWNVQPMAAEGIPIPVLYGTNKIGGNVINSVSESKFKLMEDWSTTSEQGCYFMAAPIGPFPYLNMALIGLWPWVRGFACEMDSQVWFYVFFHRRILSIGQIKSIITNLIARHSWPNSTEQFDEFLGILKKIMEKFADRSKRGGFLTVLQGLVNAARGKTLENLNIDTTRFFDNNTTIFGTDTQGLSILGKNPSQISSILADIRDLLQEAIRHTASAFQFEVVQPLMRSNVYVRTFDEYPDPLDNFGIYLVGTIPILPNAVEPKWYISDFHCLTTVSGSLDLGDFSIPAPRADFTTDTVLHQLIALGHGELAGVEKVFINDAPIDRYKGAKWDFMPGTTEQTFHGLSDSVLHNFNKTVRSNSNSTQLERAGEYVDFITDQYFPTNNVLVHCEFTAFSMSTKGRVRDLHDNPIGFVIMVTMEDNDFPSFPETYNRFNDIINHLNGDTRVLCIPYRIYGGQTESFKQMFGAIPYIDYILTNTDYFIKVFPGGVLAAMYFLNNGSLIDVNGSPFNLTQFMSITERQNERNGTGYRIATYEAIKDFFTNNYIKGQKRYRVRVMRVTSPCTNVRYTDTMTVTQFDEVSYASLSYPGISMLGLSLRASEQISGSVPKVTSIVKGKKIWVPKLVLRSNSSTQVYYQYAWFDEDIGRYRSVLHGGQPCIYQMSNGRHVWSEEYCNNPVWCLYDILTNREYGLGNYIEHFDVEARLAHWIQEAQYCDTLVPDGRMRWAESYAVNRDYFVDTESDLYALSGKTYVDETGEFLGGYESGNNTYNDTDFWKWRQAIDGYAVFAKTTDGLWTKAVVGETTRGPITGTRFTLGVLGTSTRTYPTGIWTNGLPGVDEEVNKMMYMIGEKRFQLNLAIDDETSATDRIKQICDTFRCFPIWIDGTLIPLIDRPAEPVTTIGMGSIIQDSLSIAYTPLSQVPNIYECQFSDEELFFEKHTVQVADPDIDVVNRTEVAKYARKESVNLFGITNLPQIMRELNYRLRFKKNMSRAVSFMTGIENIGLHAGDVFILNHDILTATGYSGRLLAVSGSTVVIDNDYQSQWENRGSENWKLQIRVTDYAEDGETANEFLVEYTVQSVQGNRINVSGAVLGSSGDVYAIGTSEQISQQYRAISVQPTIEGEVQITAILYDEQIYGEKRYLSSTTDDYVYYDTALINALDSTTRPIPSLVSVLPLEDFKVAPSLNESRVTISFKRPPSLTYAGAKILVWDGTATITYNVAVGQESIQHQVVDGIYYIVTGIAVYQNGSESLPKQVSFTLQSLREEYEDDPDTPPSETVVATLMPVSEIQLMWRNALSMRPIRDYFSGRTIWVKWKRASFMEANLAQQMSNNYHGHKIDYYEIVVDTKLRTQSNYAFQQIHVKDFYDNKIELSYEDLGLEQAQDVARVEKIRLTITAVASNGQTATAQPKEFFPYTPFAPNEIVVSSFLGGVYINWRRREEWENIKEFRVRVEMFDKMNPTSQPIYVSPTVTTTDHHIYIQIPLDERRKITSALSGLFQNPALPNPLGLLFNAVYNVYVSPVTEWGDLASTRSYQGQGSEETPTAILDADETVPAYLASPDQVNIQVYDSKDLFGAGRKTLDGLRLNINQYTSNYLTRRKLVDGYIGNGITYTGISGVQQCIRILIQAPVEYEYSKVLVNLSVPCKAWVEVPSRDSRGLYIVNGWDQYGSNQMNESSSSNSGTMRLINAALPIYYYKHFGAGNNEFLFADENGTETLIGAQYIILTLIPYSGTSVTVDNVRFITKAYYDELEVGTVYAGQVIFSDSESGRILFNINPNGSSLPDGPVVLNNSAQGGMALYNDGIFLYRPQSGTKSFSIDNTTGTVRIIGGSTSHIIQPGGVPGIPAMRIANGGIGIAVGDDGDITIGDSDGTPSIDLVTSGSRIRVTDGSIILGTAGNISLNSTSISLQTPDARIAVTQGYIGIAAASGIFVQSGGSIAIESGGALALIGGQIDITSSGSINLASTAKINMASGSEINMQSGGNINVLANGRIVIQSGGELYLESGATHNIVASAGGSFLIEAGEKIQLQAGSYISLSPGNDSEYGTAQLRIGSVVNPEFLFDADALTFRIGQSIYFDGSLSTMQIGTTENGILIDGGKGHISSNYFQSGIFGKGFRISNTGYAEFNDALIRGRLQSAVFEYNEVTAVGGQFVVSKADTLSHDLLSTDTVTYFNPDVVGEGLFLKAKVGFNEEIIKVSTQKNWLYDFTGKTITNVGVLQDTSKYWIKKSSADFSQSNCYMTVPASADFTFNADFTISAYIYLDTAVSVARTILSRYHSGTYLSLYGFYIDPVNGLSFSYIKTNPSSPIDFKIEQENTTGLTVGEWHHVVISRFNNVFTLYLNGDVVAVKEENIGAITFLAETPLYVGATYYGLVTDYFRNHIGSLVIKNGIADGPEKFDLYTTVQRPDDSTVLALYFTDGFFDVQRDLNLDGAKDWSKGTALIGLGTNVGDGFIILDAQSQYSPFIDICQRTGTNWNDFSGVGGTSNPYLRIGRLDGITDTDFGGVLSGSGLYAQRAFLKGSLRVHGSDGITLSGGGAIKAGKSTYNISENGFWIGEDSGLTKMVVGNDLNYFRWTGTQFEFITTETGLSGTFIRGGNIVTGSVTLDHLEAGFIDAVAAQIGEIDTNQITISQPGFLRSGKTSYSSTTSGFWLGHESGQTYPQFVVGSSSAYLRWTGSSLEVAGLLNVGNITVDSSGAIRSSGATGPTSGSSGWWMGYSSSTYQFRIGTASSTARMLWNGSTLEIASADINACSLTNCLIEPSGGITVANQMVIFNSNIVRAGPTIRDLTIGSSINPWGAIRLSSQNSIQLDSELIFLNTNTYVTGYLFIGTSSANANLVVYGNILRSISGGGTLSVACAAGTDSVTKLVINTANHGLLQLRIADSIYKVLYEK